MRKVGSNPQSSLKCKCKCKGRTMINITHDDVRYFAEKFTKYPNLKNLEQLKIAIALFKN
jgi:hypothetical protein